MAERKRPGRPAFRITPDILEETERLASLGLSNDQLAVMIGCSRTTFYAAQSRSSEFAETILRGRAKGITRVSNALFDSALKGSVPAQIFFLRNRDPNQWNQESHRVRMEVEVTKMTDAQLLEELRRDPEILASLRQLELLQ